MCTLLDIFIYIGVLPRDGKNISFKEMSAKIRSTYNFAPSFCFFVPNFAANMLNKKYGKDTFDLAELNLHNGIEHDASLTRKFHLNAYITYDMLYNNVALYIFQAKILRLYQIKEHRTSNSSMSSWPLLRERTKKETLS